MSIRSIIISLLVSVLACGVSLPFAARTASAKGSELSISPAAGGIDTQIDLSSSAFAPDAEVSFEVAFVSRIDEEPVAYSDPIAVQHANDAGRNEVQIFLRDVAGILVPRAPSFVVFRATSAAPDARIASGLFVFTVDGRRPPGSGEVRLTVSAADGTAAHNALFWWRRAGSGDDFYTPYAERLSLPLRGSIPWLDDGDWEILAVSDADAVAVGDGGIDTVSAGVCLLNIPPCGAVPADLRVKRVTIRDAQPVDVNIVLGDAQSLPSAGTGARIPNGSDRLSLAGTTLALGVLGLLAGLWTARRRASTPAAGHR